ncbi:hypothetical protein U716_15400 [Rhodobacter capsulatus B6]|nr:hypothetical protein U716_15400 [Rhodobacter capsulatus B6]
MRNLPEPTRDNDRADLKKAVRKYQHRGQTLGHDITDDEVERVVALYDRYEQDRGAPCNELKGTNLPDTLRETIHAAYAKTQNGRTLQPLRDLLFKGVDLCPVCGIDPATELDHHLPQSEFKPLAIHSRNLVPMCHPCNHAKLDGFDEDGDGFLHPYYDILPDLDFLTATIELDGAALNVSFAIDSTAALPAGYAGRLTAQMNALNLEARYQQEVNTYIASHAAALHLAYRASGQAGVQRMLRLQARYEAHAFHRNHWRPALLRALSEFNEFTGGGFAAVLPIQADMLDDLDG